MRAPRRRPPNVSRHTSNVEIGEQFRILDPASLPVRPANQAKRLQLSFAAAGIGLALGLALTVLLEIRQSTFVHEDDVARLLEVPVLALVPMMTTEPERRRRRYQRLAIDLAAGAVVVMSGAVVVAWGLTQL